MAGMDVKDRMSYAGSDLVAYAHGGVTIDRRRVVVQHAKALLSTLDSLV